MHQYSSETRERTAAPASSVLPKITSGGVRLARSPGAGAQECPVKPDGTLSQVSWGETSGLYPGKNNKYDPSKWDQTKTCELLRLRGAVHAVGKRGEKVHKSTPGTGAIDKKLRPYHLVENFPALDSEISNEKVRWFYLSDKSSLNIHPTMKSLKWVKKYGPFYNNGGGDVPVGDTWVHFYRT